MVYDLHVEHCYGFFEIIIFSFLCIEYKLSLNSEALLTTFRHSGWAVCVLIHCSFRMSTGHRILSLLFYSAIQV